MEKELRGSLKSGGLGNESELSSVWKEVPVTTSDDNDDGQTPTAYGQILIIILGLTIFSLMAVVICRCIMEYRKHVKSLKVLSKSQIDAKHDEEDENTVPSPGPSSNGSNNSRNASSISVTLQLLDDEEVSKKQKHLTFKEELEIAVKKRREKLERKQFEEKVNKNNRSSIKIEQKQEKTETNLNVVNINNEINSSTLISVPVDIHDAPEMEEEEKNQTDERLSQQEMEPQRKPSETAKNWRSDNDPDAIDVIPFDMELD